jgi:hypothetical protein
MELLCDSFLALIKFFFVQSIDEIEAPTELEIVEKFVLKFECLKD